MTTMRERVRAGDPEAFRELFREYARAVYNHAHRMVGDWSTAEEVVSLTFLEAWRLRERVDLDEDGPLRSWVLGIATNVTRNVRRAARRYENAQLRLPPEEPVRDVADGVADRLDGRQRLDAVFAAMAKLRRADREVLSLYVGGGLDHAAVAAALGVSVTAVRSRLLRARRTLARTVRSGAGEETRRGIRARRPAAGGQLGDDRGPRGPVHQESETRR